MSCYSEALDFTIATINRRASNHRNMVILTCCVIAIALFFSITSQGIVHMSILVFLFPIVGVHVFQDWKILQVWRADVLNKWSSSFLELEIFKSTLLQLPHLPDGTRTGMLSTLPDCGVASDEIQISVVSREFISRLVLLVNSLRGKLILLRSAVSTLVAGSIVFALYIYSWIPLAGCMATIMYPVAKGMWIRQSSRRIAGELRDLIKSERMDAAKVQECLDRYDWTPYQEVKLKPFELIVRN